MDNTQLTQESVTDLLAPSPTVPDADQVAGTMEEIVVEAPRGYADGLGNDLIADTHLSIKSALGVEIADEAAFKEQTKRLHRSALNLELALDSQHILRQGTLQDFSFPRKEVMVEVAQEFPVEAAIEADVELNLPYETEDAIRDVLVLADNQVISMGTRVWDRKILDLSASNYVADFLGFLPLPGRQSHALIRNYVTDALGSIPDTDKRGYFDTLRTWQNMDPRDKLAAWKGIEDAIWRISGNNALVYMGLVSPFVYEEDEVWTKFNVATDVAEYALFGYLLKPARLVKSIATIKRLMKMNERLLMKGNEAGAAKATIKKIAAKDVDAVKEGSPINFAGTDPALSPGQAPGVQLTLEDLYIYRKAVEEGTIEQGQDLFINQTPLRTSEVLAGAEEARKTILHNGNVILNETATDGQIVFTVESKAKYNVPVSQLKAERVRYVADLKAAKDELKGLVTLYDEVGENAAQKEAELLRIKGLKEEIANIDKALKQVKKLEKSGGIRVKTVAMPGTEVREVTYRFSVDNATGLGKFSLLNDEGTSIYAATIGTPEAALGHITDNLVSDTTFLRQQQRRMFGMIEKPLRQVRKRLGILSKLRSMDGTSRSNVEALLLHGDDIQRRFTTAELKRGVTVPGIGNHVFTPKEIEAYETIRDLFDDLWFLADKLQVDELNFAGYSQYYARVPDPTDPTKLNVIRIYGKSRDEDIVTSIPTTRDMPIKAAVDLDTGSPVTLDSIIDLRKKLDAGEMGFVRLREDVTINGQSYGYGLAKIRTTGKYKEVIGAKPVQPGVLDKRPGYVSKLAGENITDVAVVARNTKKDGLDLEGEFAILRGFNSRHEADIWTKKYVAENPDKPVPTVHSLAGMRTHTDRRLTELADTVDQRLFRGAFVGHREENSRFLIGMEGREMLRMDPFTSLQRYADFVSTNYPMHEWKQAQIKRFIDMAKVTDANGKPSMGSWLEIPTRWDSKLIREGNPHYKELKALQDQMRVMFSVPTRGEEAFNKMHSYLVDAFDSIIWDTAKLGPRFGEGTTSVMRGVRDAVATSNALREPGIALKGLTFDLMMSMLNIRQWFIQSSGMLITASTHPLEATLAFRDFLFLRTAQGMAKDINGFAELAKVVGMPPKEAKVLMRAWFNSGMPQSILENADFGFYHGTHGAFYSHQTAHAVRKKLRFFYDSGELNNKAFAFTLAFRRKMNEHGWSSTKDLTFDQIKEVNQEALRLNTNMGPANAAKWQNMPVVSLKTQFWQQTAKYYEAMYYALARGVTKKVYKENQWTFREGFNAAIFNLIVGGAAGYGIDEMWDGLDRWMFDPQGGNLQADNPLHAPIIAAARGGLMEYMTLRGLGFAVDVSDNVLPAAGSAMIHEAVADWLKFLSSGYTGEPAKFTLDMIFGASASIGTRFGEAFSKTLQALTGAGINIEDFSEEDVLGIVKQLAILSSQGNNASKMYTWRMLGTLTDKKGRQLHIMDDGVEVPVAALYLKLIGFDPLALEVKHMSQNKVKRDNEKLTAATTNIKEALRKQLGSDDTLPGRVERRLQTNILAAYRHYLGETLYNKAMAAAYEDFMKDGIDNFSLELYKRIFKYDTESTAAKEAALDAKINEHYRIGTKDAK